MIKVYNRDSVSELRANSGAVTRAMLFKGNKESNLSGTTPDTHIDLLVPSKGKWVNSEGYHRLWSEIGELHRAVNVAASPSAEALEALLGKIFVDIGKRVAESPDLTSVIATESTNLEDGENVNLRDILPYRGNFDVVAGTGDGVNLIQAMTGTVETVQHEIRAIGHQTSLHNLVFNKLETVQKVTEAAVNAYTDRRNALTAGVLANATYVASQKQAADATNGATYDVKMYNTFRKAIKKLYGLKNPYTDRPIVVPRIAILCNSADRWSIERVIGGQLQTGGTSGAINTVNTTALPVAEIIEYDCGITDGLAWGGKELSFPGVPQGKAIVFVPREYFFVRNKRPLTMETGRGSVLTLSQEDKAWYNIQAEWYKIILGSSMPGTDLGAGYGAAVEVTLPTDS